MSHVISFRNPTRDGWFPPGGPATDAVLPSCQHSTWADKLCSLTGRASLPVQCDACSCPDYEWVRRRQSGSLTGGSLDEILVLFKTMGVLTLTSIETYSHPVCFLVLRNPVFSTSVTGFRNACLPTKNKQITYDFCFGFPRCDKTLALYYGEWKRSWGWNCHHHSLLPCVILLQAPCPSFSWHMYIISGEAWNRP